MPEPARLSWPVVNRPLAVLLPLVLLACPGTQEKIATAKLADGCFINSDCVSPLVCAFKRCHNACDSDRDCAAGLLCVASDRPFKVCLLPQESQCVYNTDCPEGLVCAVDLRCHPECVDARDCTPNQLCVQGTCASPAQVNDAGMLTPGVTDAGAPGTPRCLYNSDCKAPHVCKGGACLDECKDERDCRSDERCTSGACVQKAGSPTDGGPAAGTDGGSGSGRACLLNSDCPMDEICGADGRCRFQCVEARDCSVGDCCYQHRCRPQSVCASLLPDGGLPQFDGGGSADGGPGYCLNDLGCDDGNFCNGIELCVNNRCQSAAHAICDDFNPCTIDMCNAVQRTCAYASSGVDAGDDDKDGHFNVKCMGTSDDCDDTNPNVFFGHPEECDFVDNNCNGAVDEGLWRERVGARIALNGTQRYPYWAGRPSVVRVDGGYLAAVSSDTIDGALEAFRLDEQLTLVQGPVELLRSSTQWVFLASNPANFGRRLLRPQLAINPDGQVLVAAWLAETGGTTGCSSSPWSTRGAVRATNAQLGPVVPWVDVDLDATFFCPGTTNPDDSTYLTAPRVAWSAGGSRWVAVWGAHYSANVKDAWAGYFDADGGMPVRHPLVPMPDPSRYYTAFHPTSPPFLAVGASNALVAFYGYSVNEPQYFLMDPSLTSRITPVQEIYQSGMIVVGAGVAPDGYYLITRAGASPNQLRRISAITGQQVGGLWTLPARVASGLSPPYGYDSTLELAIAPVRDAFLSVEQDWPNATVALTSSANDGGTVTFKLTLPSTPRSGFTLTPMDDRTAGLFWTDGQLKRTILECGN